ncbi:MAG TPA: CHAT domain-containing tetratricopeptide repeat protein, partial [Candidatus Solibacter sp.]|nr:CHAT domain-containing tetratricopeptide repeat protein [Candidatus Solibacter sp.]
RALVATSQAALSLGDYDAAIASSTEAAHIHRKAANPELEAEDWNTVGLASVYLGRYQAAIESYETALALDRKRRDTQGEIVRLCNIGNVCFEQGRYVDAYRQYQSALELVQATAGEKWNPRYRQVVAANLAILYQRLGRYQQALGFYLSLRDSADSMAVSERAQMLANLGTLYRRLGDAPKALETYREAQALFKQDHHPFGEIGVLKNIGIVLALDLERLPEALDAFERAGKLAEGSAGGQLAAIQLYIGETLRQSARYAEARASFESALAGSRQGGSSEYEWRALFGLGQIEEQAGRPAEALRLYRLAIARIESVRSGLELPVLRREFLADKRRVYDSALAILLSGPDPRGLDQRGPDPPIEQVFELMEHSRARFLQDRLPGSAVKMPGSAVKTPGPAVKTGLKEIQSRLEEGTLLLEFWAGPRGGAVLFATRSHAGILRRPMVDVSSILQAADGRLGEGWRRRSVEFGTLLLGDVPPLGAPPPGVETLRNVIIVPDGSLSLIPFELLTVPDAGDLNGNGKLLVERAAVFYAPSASLLLRDSWGKRDGWAPWGRGASWSRWAPWGRWAPWSRWAPPWSHEMLAFADPAAPSSSGGELFGSATGDSESAGSPAPAGSPERWTPLPMSAEEVRSIAGLLAGSSELHIGPDAQKRYLLADSARRFPLLHVSTHATADYQDPERSRILFAPRGAQDRADFLFLREIYGLDLKGLDLVVLSACDTETGKVVEGEGVEGFGKAFLYAGAKSTVTTLWRVDDHATAEFMKQFYYALG